MKEIYNANNLTNAFYKAKRGTDWKQSVQRYEINLLFNLLETRERLINNKYKPREMTTFKLAERGHERQIKAQHIFDRVIQRSLSDYVLLPRLKRRLIYDNGASLENKGVDFARNRFRIHLQRAFKCYGSSAHVLFMDFSGYFDNIRHDILMEELKPHLSTGELDFVAATCKEFEVDVSYLNEAEYRICLEKPFRALDYTQIPETLKTGQKMMRKSLGIGNQLSQIAGIYYPHRIDNYCKIVRGIKCYGRYMDDTYAIMRNKQDAEALLKEIGGICHELGIFINARKTHIQRIDDWLVWLKINHKLTRSGKVIRKVLSSTLRREKRRLKKFCKLLADGRMGLEDIKQCYKSWRGTYQKYDSGKELHRMDNYYHKLFGGKGND